MLFYQLLQLVSRIFLVHLKRRLQFAYLIIILSPFFFLLQLDLSFELCEVFLHFLELKLALAKLHLQFLAIFFFGVVVDGLERRFWAGRKKMIEVRRKSDLGCPKEGQNFGEDVVFGSFGGRSSVVLFGRRGEGDSLHGLISITIKFIKDYWPIFLLLHHASILLYELIGRRIHFLLCLICNSN